MSVFDKWNKAVDGEALAKDVKEVEKNGGGDFPEIPFDSYAVKVEKMELKESKKGDPMFAVQFKIVDGKFKGSFIFMNQVVTRDFQIHIVNEFLRSMDTSVNVEFDGDFSHYNDIILDVAEQVEKCEFQLEYGQNKKGYSTFKITEIYDV